VAQTSIGLKSKIDTQKWRHNAPGEEVIGTRTLLLVTAHIEQVACAEPPNGDKVGARQHSNHRSKGMSADNQRESAATHHHFYSAKSLE
jgi:hypothetical protein